jgi:hypothetical protein
VISIYDSQKDARNIEQGFMPGHKNVNCLQDKEAKGSYDTNVAKSGASIVSKPATEPDCMKNRVLLEPNPSAKPRKQHPHRTSDEAEATTKAEVKKSSEKGPKNTTTTPTDGGSYKIAATTHQTSPIGKNQDQANFSTQTSKAKCDCIPRTLATSIISMFNTIL